MQITLLVLIRKFQISKTDRLFKVPLLGEVETAVKSWFAVMGENDSILGLLFLFQQGELLSMFMGFFIFTYKSIWK